MSDQSKPVPKPGPRPRGPSSTSPPPGVAPPAATTAPEEPTTSTLNVRVIGDEDTIRAVVGLLRAHGVGVRWNARTNRPSDEGGVRTYMRLVVDDRLRIGRPHPGGAR